MRWKAAALLVAGFVAVNCFPYSAGPNFRYTGSDPSIHVWNFGWPLASAIYDKQSGLHWGPFIEVVLPTEAVALTVAVIIFSIASKARRSPAPER